MRGYRARDWERAQAERRRKGLPPLGGSIGVRGRLRYVGILSKL